MGTTTKRMCEWSLCRVKMCGQQFKIIKYNLVDKVIWQREELNLVSSPN